MTICPSSVITPAVAPVAAIGLTVISGDPVGLDTAMTNHSAPACTANDPMVTDVFAFTANVSRETRPARAARLLKDGLKR